MLSVDEITELFEYRDGNLYWKTDIGPTRRYKAGTLAGRKEGTATYNSVGVRGQRLYIHKLIWALHNKKHPEHQIDHINCNKWDNKIENLREVSPGVNNQNIRKARSHSKLGLLGVSVYKNKYKAAIMRKGRTHYLGIYTTKTQAHNAYMFAKEIFHKEAFNLKGA